MRWLLGLFRFAPRDDRLDFDSVERLSRRIANEALDREALGNPNYGRRR